MILKMEEERLVLLKEHAEGAKAREMVEHELAEVRESNKKLQSTLE